MTNDQAPMTKPFDAQSSMAIGVVIGASTVVSFVSSWLILI
jgi:hypothetical protein